MAEEERQTLKQNHAALELALKLQLLPKDAADDSSAIVEIRAGTGGDEAALFAADLLGMYRRYAQLQGWKVDMLSISDSDLGGVREAVMEVVGQAASTPLRRRSRFFRNRKKSMCRWMKRI